MTRDLVINPFAKEHWHCFITGLITASIEVLFFLILCFMNLKTHSDRRMGGRLHQSLGELQGPLPSQNPPPHPRALPSSQGPPPPGASPSTKGLSPSPKGLSPSSQGLSPTGGHSSMLLFGPLPPPHFSAALLFPSPPCRVPFLCEAGGRYIINRVGKFAGNNTARVYF